mgnify:CR=1 FL=1
MNKRSFVLTLALAFTIFAIISLGGCGGGSSSHNGAYEPEEETSVSMNDVFDDNEAVNEIISRLSFDLLELVDVPILEISKNSADASLQMQDRTIRLDNSDEEREFLYSVNTLRSYYENGSVIIIEEPDLSLINKVRGDLDLSDENSDITGDEGSLELYALAFVSGDVDNDFVYIIPRMDDVESSAELEEAEAPVSSDEAEPESVEETPEKEFTEDTEYTMRDAQIDRWVRFLQWIIRMGDNSKSNSAFATEYEIRKAADDNDLVKIAKAQTRTFDFSKYDPNKKCYSNVGDSMKYDVNRATTVDYVIYSVHSFSNHNDYYLVLCDATTTPKNFGDTTRTCNSFEQSLTFNFLYGYTRGFYVESHIDDGKMSASDVAIMNAIPTNINASTNHSETMGWQLGGKLGFSGKGATGEISGSISHSETKSWTTTEYSLLNETRKEYIASAKWRADMNLPSDGSSHSPASHMGYTGVNATNASKNSLTLHSEWVWSVSQNYWKDHSKVTMKVHSHVEDGWTHGESRHWHGFLYLVRYYWDRGDGYYEYDGYNSLDLDRPVHIATNVKSFAFTSKGEASQSFTLLSESNWTISSNVDWLKFTRTSGSATGETEYAVMFDVAENTTSSPREGIITLSAENDKINIQVLQSGVGK